ncbi:hypothetical protein [Arthrobacter sp. ISL-30]|uniref:hypothetical protein n=1 Tax=Arthrobacter sp. ISL-30 TaxID=2819109 RepID=UPI001BE4EE76|nr:hypothetical protein [Arthrobacter sp. ISL-30]MBT2513853.1 hypothetical protein [Arthrobacter sp. ISL-30]
MINLNSMAVRSGPSPRSVRVVPVITGAIAVVLLINNLRPGASGSLPNVNIPWPGVTEAAVLILALLLAWAGRIWAYAVVVLTLLFVIVHSYWLAVNDPWMGGHGNPLEGTAVFWRTGFAAAFVIADIPSLAVIVVLTSHLLRALRALRPRQTRIPDASGTS